MSSSSGAGSGSGDASVDRGIAGSGGSGAASGGDSLRELHARLESAGPSELVRLIRESKADRLQVAIHMLLRRTMGSPELAQPFVVAGGAVALCSVIELDPSALEASVAIAAVGDIAENLSADVLASTLRSTKLLQVLMEVPARASTSKSTKAAAAVLLLLTCLSEVAYEAIQAKHGNDGMTLLIDAVGDDMAPHFISKALRKPGDSEAIRHSAVTKCLGRVLKSGKGDELKLACVCAVTITEMADLRADEAQGLLPGLAHVLQEEEDAVMLAAAAAAVSRVGMRSGAGCQQVASCEGLMHGVGHAMRVGSPMARKVSLDLMYQMCLHGGDCRAAASDPAMIDGMAHVLREADGELFKDAAAAAYAMSGRSPEGRERMVRNKEALKGLERGVMISEGRALEFVTRTIQNICHSDTGHGTVLAASDIPRGLARVLQDGSGSELEGGCGAVFAMTACDAGVRRVLLSAKGLVEGLARVLREEDGEALESAARSTANLCIYADEDEVTALLEAGILDGLSRVLQEKDGESLFAAAKTVCVMLISNAAFAAATKSVVSTEGLVRGLARAFGVGTPETLGFVGRALRAMAEGTEEVKQLMVSAEGFADETARILLGNDGVAAFAVLYSLKHLFRTGGKVTSVLMESDALLLGLARGLQQDEFPGQSELVVVLRQAGAIPAMGSLLGRLDPTERWKCVLCRLGLGKLLFGHVTEAGIRLGT